MTGIERLRELADDVIDSVWANTNSIYCKKYGLSVDNTGGSFSDFLRQIADQIEAEQDERVTRRLEDREAAEWVREHGGLDEVKRRWECLSHYADPVPRSCMEKRLARLQRQIDESYAALRRRNRWITELEHLLCKEMSYSLRRDAGCLAPKVLDADGVEIRVGDTVWHVETGEQCKVVEVDSRSVSVDFRVDGDGTKHTGSILPANLTHRAPVLAADGEPLEVGQTVWDTNGDELVIGALEDGGHTVTCRYVDVGDAIPVHGMWSPSDLTHERPVADTWERIEEDAGCTATKYNERRGTIFTTKQQVARDLVRRCRALAERERGE